jgi:DNA repair ATPase RecN
MNHDKKIKHIMKTVNEIEEKGINVLQKLHQQGEQLDNDDKKLEIINEKLSRTNKILNRIKRLLRL